MRWKTARAGAILLSVAMLVAACSSSAKSGSTGSTGATGGSDATTGNAKLTGEPVKLGLLGDLTVAGADSHPDAWKLAQIAAAAVNDSGGINGRPLQLVVCDSKADPQTAVLCAQQLLVQDKVVAMVGSFETEQNAVLYPVLDQANTINFGGYPSAPLDFSSPKSYPIVSGPLPYLALPQLVPSTSKKVAIVYGLSAPATAVAKGLEKKLPPGVQSTLIGIPVTGVVDMSPYCLQLQTSKADSAMVLIATSVFDQLLNTCNQKGVSGVTWLTTDFGLDNPGVKMLESTTPAPKTLLTFAGPAMNEMQQQVAEYGEQYGNPTDTVSGLVKNSWMSVTIAAQVLKKLPTISGAAFQAYLDKQTSLHTGGTYPLNFSKPGPNAEFPRITNTYAAPGTLQNGNLVQTGPFINVNG